jgi:hypothetical protein
MTGIKNRKAGISNIIQHIILTASALNYRSFSNHKPLPASGEFLTPDQSEHLSAPGAGPLKFPDPQVDWEVVPLIQLKTQYLLPLKSYLLQLSSYILLFMSFSKMRIF